MFSSGVSTESNTFCTLPWASSPSDPSFHLSTAYFHSWHWPPGGSIPKTQHNLYLFWLSLALRLIVAKTLLFPANVPVVQHCKYLGIHIFPSLNHIVTHNYSEAWNRIKADLDRWFSLPNSLQACISMAQMNILSRIHSVLPLSHCQLLKQNPL